MGLDNESFLFKIQPQDLYDRLTVESYLPEVMYIKDQLKQGLFLGQIASITKGQTPKKPFFKGGSILFLKTQNVQEGFIDLENSFHITDEAHNSILKRSKILPGDVLYTIVGASPNIIGRAVVFPRHLNEANINQNIAKIRIFNEKFIKPKYIEAFLDSQLGRAQSEMLSRSIAQYNLSLSEVKKIKIPIPRPEDQDEISLIWEERKNSIIEINNEIRNGLDIINGDVILSDYGIDIQRPSDIKLFQIEGKILENDLTVEYYLSKYIQNTIKEESDGIIKLEKIKNLVKFRKKSISPREYPDKYFKLLYISQDGKTGLREERLGKEIKSKYMKEIREGDIIISRIGGIKGAISIVPKWFDKSLVSSEYIVLICDQDKLINVYLWKILRSEWMKIVLEGFTTGGSRLRIGEKRFMELLIPVPPLNLQRSLSAYIITLLENIKSMEEDKNTIMIKAKQAIQNKILEVLQREDYDVFKNIVLDMTMNVIEKHKDALKELAKY